MITVSHGLAMVGIDSLGAYAKTISEFEDLPVANWELAHMKLFALKVNFCSMTTNVAFKRRAEASIRCPFMADVDGEDGRDHRRGTRLADLLPMLQDDTKRVFRTILDSSTHHRRDSDLVPENIQKMEC